MFSLAKAAGRQTSCCHTPNCTRHIPLHARKRFPAMIKSVIFMITRRSQHISVGDGDDRTLRPPEGLVWYSIPLQPEGQLQYGSRLLVFPTARPPLLTAHVRNCSRAAMSGALTVVMGKRLQKTGKMMPSAPVAAISLGMSLFYCYQLVKAKPPSKKLS